MAFTECPSVARDLGRSTSNSTNPSQPSPDIGPSLTPGGGVERDRARNGPRERAGRAFLYDPETGSYPGGKSASASFFTSTLRFVANFRPCNCSVITSNGTTRKLPKKIPRHLYTGEVGLPDRPTDRPGYVRLAGTIPNSHAKRQFVRLFSSVRISRSPQISLFALPPPKQQGKRHRPATNEGTGNVVG